MKYAAQILSIVFLSLFVACKNAPREISIIPQPTNIVELEGSFTINQSTVIKASADSLFGVAAYLQDLLAEAGVVLQINSEKTVTDPNNRIVFTLVDNDARNLGSEGYYLEVTKQGIYIEATTCAGCFYAVQTLRQLMPEGFETKSGGLEKLSIPCVQITDKPKFAWRGLHLDCCRHFMDKEFVMRYIDLIAYHKMNILHWHLTDDQGWRIEIDAYPKLTEVGAWRTEVGEVVHGGFYTKEDIREVVEYAAQRFVNIVPEVEMPGHAIAALASYPQLSCTGQQIEVETSWGVFKDIFCAGNENTYTFLQNVLSEVVELFPFRYIHIGGDEVPKYRWENCPRCKALLKSQKLANYEDMQRYFIDRISHFLETKNRKIIGWDEIMESGIPYNATIQAWRGIDKVNEAVHKNLQVIAMPTSHCYLDYPVGVTSLQKVYTYDPIPQNISPEQQKLVLGGECGLWTERAPQQLADSRIFPRLLAVSEVLWSYPAERNFDEFKARVRNHYSRLSELGVRYGFEQDAVIFSDSLSADCSSLTVTIESGAEYFNIHYTTDGTEPTTKSEIYKKPIILTQSTGLKAAAFNKDAQVGEVFVNEIVLSKSTGRGLSLGYTPAKQYMGGGEKALVDGRMGSDFYNDGIWQAVQGLDKMQATVDLQKMQEITYLSVGFLQSNPSWIFIPSKVIFYVSSDGINFSEIAQVESPIKPDDGGNIIYNFEVEVNPTSCQFVKMEAISIGPCPQWHPAAGSPSWLFADEFVVN